MSVTINGSGQIVAQVVSTLFTTVISQAGSGGTWYSMSGFSANITPSNSANKVLVMVTIGRVACASGTTSVSFRINRSGTPVGVGVPTGSSSGNNAGNFLLTAWGSDSQQGGGGSFAFLDSPSSTSALTYSIDWQPQNSFTYYLNRTGNNVSSTDSFGNYTSSTITLLEITGA